MTETVFTYAAPALKFGAGAAAEVGHDLQGYGARRVLLVTDPGVAATGHPARIAEQIEARGLHVTTYDRVHVEPTDASLAAAIDFARDAGPFDAILAVGGGSAIDTAKAVNLLTTNPGELMDYINAPVGKAQAPTERLLPLVAIPTTTGTGSESTTICVLDVLSLKVKTGISHPALRPTLAVVDPTLTASQPAMVTAASGMDILCHALESYTARWFADFDAKRPEQRVPYCGANPIADMWSEKALSLLAGAFRRGGARRLATAGPRADGDGRHLCRARLRQRRGAHPARQRLPDRRPGARLPPRRLPAGRGDRAARHGRLADGAGRLRVHVRGLARAPPARSPAARSHALQRRHRPRRPARVLRTLMRDIGIPNGLAAVGYAEADVDDLVQGSLQQQRLLATAPREVRGEDLATVFRASMEHW